MLIWTTLAVLAVLSAVGVALGFRGRRFDDHPVCRRCRFDLVGVEAARCPECGRDLAERKAVRIGNRRRRPAFIAVGSLALLLSITGAGVIGWGAANKFNWNTIKPAWLLIVEAESSIITTSQAALDELVSRAVKRTLARATHARLAARALELQADPLARWSRSWGDLVEIAHARGMIDDETALDYIRRAFDVSISLRSPLAHGAQPTLHMIPDGVRGGTGAYAEFSIVFTIKSLRFDGEIIPTPKLHMQYKIGPGKVSVFTDIASAVTLATPGEHTIDTEILAWARPIEARGAPGTSVELLGDDHPRAEGDSEPWTISQSTTVELLPPGASDIILTPDPSLAQAVRDSIRIDSPTVIRRADSVDLSLVVMIDRPPVGVAFEIFAVAGEQEISIGQGAAGIGMTNGFSAGARGLDPAFTSPTLRFRASASPARRTSGLTEIWEGEFDISNIIWTTEEEP